MRLVKKRVMFPLMILACILLAGLGWCLAHRVSVFTGRYLQAGNGAHIVVDRSGAPVILEDRTSRPALFDGLSDGDRVLVLCDGILDSYPARAYARFCVRLGGGAAADLPADTLRQLSELGWVSPGGG